MKVIPTKLSGVLIIDPKVYGDERGFFLETFQAKRYKEAGIDYNFVQDNHSRSAQGVLRGLHFQKNQPQGKLVYVMRGEVFDVAVDINPQSPTYQQWEGLYLNETNKRQLFIPPGYAHGFLVTSESADFVYKCTDYYNPEDEGSVNWADPDIQIEWPFENPTLSEKDRQAPFLKELFPV